MVGGDHAKQDCRGNPTRPDPPRAGRRRSRYWHTDRSSDGRSFGDDNHASVPVYDCHRNMGALRADGAAATDSVLAHLRLPNDPAQAAHYLARAEQAREDIHRAHDRPLAVGPQADLAAELAGLSASSPAASGRRRRCLGRRSPRHSGRPPASPTGLAAGALQ
jgi:hypothetical protein